MSEVQTSTGIPLNGNLLHNYFRNLVNQFFKILPMREKGEDSLYVFMQSLQVELIGCKTLISDVRENSLYLTLLAILQYLMDNPDCSITVVRREVFRAISICNKLKALYTGTEMPE